MALGAVPVTVGAHLHCWRCHLCCFATDVTDTFVLNTPSSAAPASSLLLPILLPPPPPRPHPAVFVHEQVCVTPPAHCQPCKIHLQRPSQTTIFLEHSTGNSDFGLLLLMRSEQIKILALAQIRVWLADPLRLDPQGTKQGSRPCQKTLGRKVMERKWFEE